MRRRDHRDRDKDRDRDRHRGDRKRGNEKEAEKSGSTTGENPKPIVLLKRPETIAASSLQGTTSSSSELPKKEIPPPDIRPNKEGSQSTSKPGVILLRSSLRAESFPDLCGAGVAPTPTTISTTTGDTSSAPEVKTLFQKSTTKSQPVVNIPEVKRPYQPNLKQAIPLINATDKMSVVQESELEFIGPNASSQDFFVITAVGKPQSGKSSILSYLASSSEKFGGKEVFLTRKLCQEKECSVYITSNNIMFIEMASVFNGAATNDMMSLMPQSTLEIATINWNMRILNWALSVSHLVLIVSESLVDPNFLQLLNSSAMVHPVESVFGDGFVAEIAFICNKASNSLLEDEELQNVSEYVFNQALGKPSTISRNFFVLPNLQTKVHEERYAELRDRIDDFVRYNRAMHKLAKFPQNITMSNWLSSCSRIWSEDLGNSSGFSSYVKLLP